MSDTPAEKEAKSGKKPTDLVTRGLVEDALHEEEGKEATLLDWKTVDFTTIGDNYACVVSSVELCYLKNDQISHKTYIVKLNPCRDSELFRVFTSKIFLKESSFYKEIIPALNKELEEINVPELNIPKYVHSSLIEDHEILFLEDLRKYGFKMNDRRKGLDVSHMTLILQELAKLHASSKLIKAKMEETTFLEKFPFLFDVFLPDENSPESTEQIKVMFSGYMENGAKITEAIGGYESIAKWTRDFGPRCSEVFTKILLSEDKFSVICHGDCWNNNILFRYDDEGKPVEAKLLDLQLCRESSLGTDLNYLMYTSLNGKDRKPNLYKFLNIYYTTFSSILDKAGLEPIFTEDELVKEYHNKNIFGFIMALLVMPIVIAEAKDAPDFNDIQDENLDSVVEEQGKKIIETLNTNPLLRPRFLDMYDEMIEYNVIGTDI